MAAIDQGHAADLISVVIYLDADDGMEGAVFVQVSGRERRFDYCPGDNLPKATLMREVVPRRTSIVRLLHPTSVPQPSTLDAYKQTLATGGFWHLLSVANGSFQAAQ